MDDALADIHLEGQHNISRPYHVYCSLVRQKTREDQEESSQEVNWKCKNSVQDGKRRDGGMRPRTVQLVLYTGSVVRTTPDTGNCI